MIAILTGCGKEPCVTLVKCKTTADGVEYYYDTHGDYYWKQPEEDYIYPILDVGLKNEPVATLPLSAVDYALKLVEPSRYTGDLYDIKGYLNRLADEGYTYEIRESTPTMLDIQATNGADKIRIVYIQDDVVRVYSVNSYGISQTPPYLQ